MTDTVLEDLLADTPAEKPAPEPDAGDGAVVTEIKRILPETSEFKLTNGCVVIIERLRTRQFLKLVKILTRGAGNMLMEYRLDGDLGSDEFQGRLVALIGLSIPEAEDEAIEFLRSMTTPAGLVVGSARSLSKEANERNQALWADYEEAMENPELDDLIDILERIVKNEADDMQRLGKRLVAMIQLATKTTKKTPAKE